MSEHSWPEQIAFVLWSGHLGGAERHTVELARIMHDEMGLDVGIVFIEEVGRSGEILDTLGVPWRELGFSRGSEAALHPRLVAQTISEVGADVAILGYGGYLARACRLGGYRGVLLAVEHGGIMQVPSWTMQKKVRESVSRAIGESALDATICVSGHIRDIVCDRIHSQTVEVVYNGVDLTQYAPAERPPDNVVFGHAGRLIEGKGILNLVNAFDREIADAGGRLLIAGDGPARREAERIVEERDLRDCVEFLGVVSDMPGFWRRCSVVVHPTTQAWKESFCLAVVEGMATGLPALVSDVGALSEIIDDGVTGTLIQPDDVAALRMWMRRYVDDPELRERQGIAARARVVERFDVRRAAREYLDVARDARNRRPA